MFDIVDKVTVITGGSSGIGAAAARRFAQAGAKVVIAARGDAGALAEEIGAAFVKTDVSVEQDVVALMTETVRRFGRIDVLINNAGMYAGAVPLEERTTEQMLKAFAVNTLGPLYGMKHAVRHMKPGSAIINTSSLAGLVGMAGYVDYATSKFGVNGLTLCAALELGPRGIRVNAICPPSVNTPMLANSDVAEVEAMLTKTTSALGRIIEPEEVAALMHYLASDDSLTFSGQLIRLDAGMSAGYSVAMCNSIAAHAGFN